MLFGGIDPAIKEYSLQVHLAEIVSYLGLPPTDLLMRGAKSHKVFDSEGMLAVLVDMACWKSLNANVISEFHWGRRNPERRISRESRTQTRRRREGAFSRFHELYASMVTRKAQNGQRALRPPVAQQLLDKIGFMTY